MVAAWRHLSKLFEGWIVATPDRRRFAVRITSYPQVDISVPFDWKATAAEVTERGMPLPGFKRVAVAQTWFMPPSTASSMPEM